MTSCAASPRVSCVKTEAAMKLRILDSEWRAFVDEICARTDVESAGIILAERLDVGVLLARQLTLLPEVAYEIRRPDQIRIHPVALNRLVRPARDCGLSVLTVHTHPGAEDAWFSTADDAGDAVLMPSLFAQMPGPPRFARHRHQHARSRRTSMDRAGHDSAGQPECRGQDASGFTVGQRAPREWMVRPATIGPRRSRAMCPS